MWEARVHSCKSRGCRGLVGKALHHCSAAYIYNIKYRLHYSMTKIDVVNLMDSAAISKEQLGMNHKRSEGHMYNKNRWIASTTLLKPLDWLGKKQTDCLMLTGLYSQKRHMWRRYCVKKKCIFKFKRSNWHLNRKAGRVPESKDDTLWYTTVTAHSTLPCISEEVGKSAVW